MHEAATICLCPSMPHAAAQHTLHLQRSACLASSSCGCHEYSQCMRQTDVVRRHQTSDTHHCLMPPPYQDGGIIKFLWQAVLVSSISVDSVISFYVLLDRLPKVDLIILEGEKCPSIHPYVRPSVHKKFLRFQ